MDFIVDLIVLHIIANEDIVVQTYSDYPVTTIPTRIADRVGIFYADAGTACISKKNHLAAFPVQADRHMVRP